MIFLSILIILQAKQDQRSALFWVWPFRFCSSAAVLLNVAEQPVGQAAEGWYGLKKPVGSLHRLMTWTELMQVKHQVIHVFSHIQYESLIIITYSFLVLSKEFESFESADYNDNPSSGS